MDPTRTSTQVRVIHCSLCQGDTEYYCHHCQQNMCLQCKKIHVIDIDTKDHEVTRYVERAKISPKQVSSERSRDSDDHEPYGFPLSDPHPDYKKSRVLCPGLLSPSEHNRHNEIEQRPHSKRIHYLRGETLYYRHVLLERLRYDVKTGHKTVTIRGQTKAKDRGQELKDLIDYVLAGDLQDRSLIQKTRLSKHIARLRIYENRCVRYSSRPVKYLRFIKHKNDPQKDEQKLINRLVELMKGMHLSTETQKRQAGNELLLTLMPSPVLQKSLTVKGIDYCRHIAFVTPDRVWVNDDNKIILTNTTGDKLYSVDDSLHSLSGLHTVNSKCELIYIQSEDKNINKLSNDMKTTTTLIGKPESPWTPWCVYNSPSSGDLLVGMWRDALFTETGRYKGQVMRYNNSGEHTQTIPHDNTPATLYSKPLYITENNNEDVVVSDMFCVVVTEREGRHRFSYTAPPSGSPLWPHGICTDAMSHILVCDQFTNTVQMISKDGEFLSYLLTNKSSGIHGYRPFSLSYDVNTHLLWVGSENKNTVSIYRFINRHLTITDDKEFYDDVSCSSPNQSISGYSQEEFDVLQAKKRASNAANTMERKAAEAQAAAIKAKDAVKRATVVTKYRKVAELEAEEAREAAEKAAKEAAAARAAADAATKAETKKEALTAANAAIEVEERAIRKEFVSNDYRYYDYDVEDAYNDLYDF